MNIEQEMKNAEQNLIMSQTMERLWQLSQGSPTNIKSPDDLKEAFSTCGVELINALDNNRIHFDKMEDKAIFYALLSVTIDYVMDGKLKTSFTKASVN
jgi:hypothetical protein